ncbi:MAG: gephyrin-like molybdotransferase receptor GlpR [Mycobacterium sp.]
MPSIPQSLLWISLVVLWLFVLVPMLISKRDAVRRTSDVALATRVLNGGAASRLLRRKGPAAGHRSDPDWKPDLDDVDRDEHSEEDEDRDADQDTDARPTHPVVMKFAVPEQTEPDYLDVDVIEDSGALPAGVSAAETEPLLEADEAETVPHSAEDEHDDEYEYIEDSSGLEPDEDDDDAFEDGAAPPVAPAASRRRRFDAEKAAAVTARKYVFRKRVLMVMAVVLVASATAAFEVTPTAWWVCGTATGITVLYLAYLRRQTRIEEKVRRRRMHRMARARLGVENAADREFDVVPSRLRRPGAVVLEIDDEDPIFEHLDYDMPVRAYGWPRDLPRAVGQ